MCENLKILVNLLRIYMSHAKDMQDLNIAWLKQPFKTIQGSHSNNLMGFYTPRHKPIPWILNICVLYILTLY